MPLPQKQLPSSSEKVTQNALGPNAASHSWLLAQPHLAAKPQRAGPPSIDSKHMPSAPHCRLLSVLVSQLFEPMHATESPQGGKHRLPASKLTQVSPAAQSQLVRNGAWASGTLETQCPASNAQKQTLRSLPHWLLSVQMLQAPFRHIPLRQSRPCWQVCPLAQRGQSGPPQSMAVSPPFFAPSRQLGPGGGGGEVGGGDAGGEPRGGGELAQAPRVAPCLRNDPFLLFFTRRVCPFRQRATFFLPLAGLSPALARPSAFAASTARMVRRGVASDQERTTRSNCELSMMTPRWPRQSV